MKLSRETRDSLFLIGVVTLCVAPHLQRLPLWASTLTLGLLAWRGWLAWEERPLPSRWLLAALLLAVVAGAKLTHGVVIGRQAGLTLVCVLLAMKLLELHARRDAFVVFFLGFFLVLAQYLHSQAIWVAAWSLLAVWGLLTCLVLAQMPLGQPSLRTPAREAARSTLLGLPLMVMLFLVFPRVGPLWGLPGGGGGTGLGDSLHFGDVAQLALDESVALRLRALDGQSLPPPEQLYIRGPVLSQFDGRIWRIRPQAGNRPDLLQLQGGVLRYQAWVEPQPLPLLPLLEMAPGQPGESWRPTPTLELTRDADLSWVARRPLREALRFEQVAVVDPEAVRIGPLDWEPSLVLDLQLPRGSNPRLAAWARQLAAELPDPRLSAERAQQLNRALLAHIRREPFGYTLAPGAYGENSPHMLDEFWFERRLGFCEHYASTYVFALRAAGVPARVVTGFLGADPLPVEGWTLVRNSYAHAWAEYWAPGLGWRRVDPTAAVAPERVQRNQLLRASPGLLRGAFDAMDPALWLRLRQLAEGIDLRWRDWVLGYQQQQQFRLLEKLGFESPNWSTLGRVAAGLISALALGAWIWQRWQARPRSPWPARLARVRAALEAAGIAAPAHEAPLRWAERSRHAGLRQALLDLEAWRYGEGPDPGWRPWWRRFRAALAEAGER